SHMQTPETAFINNVTSNGGYHSWHLVSGDLIVKDVCYKKLLHWSGQTICYADNKFYVVKNDVALPFSDLEACRAYLTSRAA
uniref:Non-structural protein 3 n=1 Tax=Bat coronavirus HKU4 TaxID=694007 RepID=UPI0011EA5FDB|nr:Chain A, Non-structural protein 3 [Tylonycteris bat coronavirus HKU4]